jgi:hypothetical protein
LSDFWDASLCCDCRLEDYDFIDGKVPCETELCRFSCKHLNGPEQKKRKIQGRNPWRTLHAGGLDRAIEISNQVIALSPYDNAHLPTSGAFSYWSGEVPYSESLFWTLMSGLLSDRRNAAARAINQRINPHG